ncbi:type IV secretory system conjugative DNA transfer family protein [Streptomyces tailanensis]|uniref:type IV secretory system conjugative DNA transfer family protein n=1 Tax=Streptomyces tailanensis TaxID=2569858 RepID=UPI00155A231D|nr:type IV secretion system DNA-binding domain-containing protein [Streptomyces tailanensis]
MTEEWLRLWQDEIDRSEAYAREQARLEAWQRELAEVTSATIVLGRDMSTDQPVTVTAEELCSGTYLLGTQGAGKSSLLEQIVYQRMEQHDSVIVLDPHGELIDNIIARMPEARLSDTYLLDLSNARGYPFHLNIFHCADPSDETERARTRGRVLRVFRRIWPEIEAGQYAEKLLRHVTNTLIYNPDCTLVDVPEWFRSSDAVRPALRNVQVRDTRAFWEHDLFSLSPRERSIQMEPFLNRLSRLLSDDLLRRLLCAPGSPLDVAQLVQQRRSLFIKLPVDSDVMGEAAGLVGVALFSLFYAATFDERDKGWRDSYTLIVDEFHNFVTSEFVKLFVGGRKYGARLVLAHQYMNQLDQPGLDMNKRGVLTARNVVCFHTTPHDAVEVASLFAQLEKNWNRPNLVADVASALDHHPVEAVKSFAMRHVYPLIQGSRMRAGDYLDFGWGERHFTANNVRRTLALLNEFLYTAERDGRVNNEKMDAFIEAMSEIAFPYGDKETVAASLHADLSTVSGALIGEPILERPPVSSAGEVTTELPSLRSRTAFIRAGEHAFHMETYPLPDKMAGHAAKQREAILFEQTHREYCSLRDAVDERIANSPCGRRPSQLESAQPSRRDAPSARGGSQPPVPSRPQQTIGRRSPKKRE